MTDLVAIDFNLWLRGINAMGVNPGWCMHEMNFILTKPVVPMALAILLIVLEQHTDWLAVCYSNKQSIKGVNQQLNPVGV